MLDDRDLVNLIKEIVSELDDTKINFVESKSDDGLAWVKDGKVYVSEPEKSGKPAVIVPGEDIQLYVNDKLINEEVCILPQDRVEIKIPSKQKIKGKYKLEVSNDKMEAYLYIEPTKILEHVLVDQEPQKKLILNTTTKEKLECPITIKQLGEYLQKANILPTLMDLSEAIILFQNPKKAKVVVARGVPPKPPVDEKVDIRFPLDKKIPVKDDGTVDYRNINKLFTVEEGALLACKKPSVPGEPGINVYGEIIRPAPPRKKILVADKGAFLSEDGEKVFAKKSGHPILRKVGQTYFFRVEDILVHEGDVDFKSGNIIFYGSLVAVYGNVYKSMTVQSSGQLFIQGIVSGAKIISYDSMKIQGNSFNSVISAGIFKDSLDLIQNCIDELEGEILKIIQIISILYEQQVLKGSKMSYGYVLKLVIEKVKMNLPRVVKKLNDLCNSSLMDLPENINKIIFLANRIINYPHTVDNEDILSTLLKGVKLLKDYFHSMGSRKANIEIKGAANCQISATGDVTVRGPGCTNTLIEAGGNVNINKVFRGGEIKSAGDILIGEVGTKTGLKTTIRTSESKKIMVKLCNEGVTLAIGKKFKRIDRRVSNLLAYLDKDGELKTKFF